MSGVGEGWVETRRGETCSEKAAPEVELEEFLPEGTIQSP